MANRKKSYSIYRKCSCGETAHDISGDTDAENVRLGFPPGAVTWRCRNCGRRISTRRAIAYAERSRQK